MDNTNNSEKITLSEGYLDEINGIAIMSDTDNSKLSSIGYYQNIYFSSE